MAGSATAKISVRGLRKSFGRNRVLDNLDLDCGTGESLVIIGGSGTGKSVLVKCILGLLQPEAGSIRIDGVETTGLRRAARESLMQKFGMLFQGSALFDSLRVWENVAFGLIQGRGMERKEAEKIALAKLAAVRLGPEVGELRPAELSGGMQKRVALARALAAEPEIIFFDEPTTGLDPILVNTIHHLILDLHRRFRFTALMVSHEIPEIFEIADRVGMLHEGRILEVGPPAAIQASQNVIVQQFIRGAPDAHARP